MNSLCDKHDIVFFQENWLWSYDLALLNTAHSEFSPSTYVVDISSDILVECH